ncbi:hypothetical protein G9A89_014724 [Geosiphon pyriformis]|nr:hypothetical protein G9A89_014724 [Geosiphon pyriformis]
MSLKRAENKVERPKIVKFSNKVEVSSEKEINFLRHMAKIANMAYCRPENEIGKVMKRHDIVADIWRRREGDGRLIVYFRGPELNKGQWLKRTLHLNPIDMRTDVKGSLVDVIWLEHVQTMMPLLITKLERLSMSPQKVFFVGHGVGGAYAVLTALYFCNAIHNGVLRWNHNFSINDISVITFGAPRIGNPAFVSLVKHSFRKETVFRVTHWNDWVSRDFMSKGVFLHNEREYWLNYENDCGCLSKKQLLSKCIGRNSNGEIDENKKCNLGTVDSEEGNHLSDLNHGPYFDVFFGKCQ